MSAERIVRMSWKGPIASFMQDTTAEIDMEGALNCGKTTGALWKEWNKTQEHPGIWSFIGRYGDGETQAKVKPAWEAICQQAGGVPKWNSKEMSYDFANGSRVFSHGLKSPDAMSRYAKLRGLGVSRIYIEQAEELPDDISLELRSRLRQSGFPHQLTFTPNPMNVSGNWLAEQFPVDNSIKGRQYYALSIFDNAHNLPPDAVESALRTYPEYHAKHRSMVLGQRGMNVVGVPVYRGYFQRSVHVAALVYNPHAPLLVAIDFGKHHPCVVIGQQPYSGGLHVLGGILGEDMFLDDFLPLVQQTIAGWWPSLPGGIEVCCDPAGSHQNSQGARFSGVDIVKRFKWLPSWRDNANAPDVRAATIESIGALMRRRGLTGECFQVESASDRWLRVGIKGTHVDTFVTDALEAGYVWDEHMVSVGNKQIRKPKKDGWFEHGMNCLEYLELNFGADHLTAEGLARRRAQRPTQPLPRASGPNAWMG